MSCLLVIECGYTRQKFFSLINDFDAYFSYISTRHIDQLTIRHRGAMYIELQGQFFQARKVAANILGCKSSRKVKVLQTQFTNAGNRKLALDRDIVLTTNDSQFFYNLECL
ncbi:hypothetical protein BD408DRAFT_423367 [Parasitella parasitica]|nr:hypothetical protein BD408DRAFT_423367 [Parasitella parasitica]